MTIIVRAVGAGALFLMTLSSDAYAVRQHRPAARISCSDVRYYVAKYSAPVAEMYARGHGASDAQIERARRCLASNEAVETGQRRSYTEWTWLDLASIALRTVPDAGLLEIKMPLDEDDPYVQLEIALTAY